MDLCGQLIAVATRATYINHRGAADSAVNAIRVGLYTTGSNLLVSCGLPTTTKPPQPECA